jgi:hypothetical protein
MGTLIEDRVASCGLNLAKTFLATEEADTCSIQTKRRHPSRRGELLEVVCVKFSKMV